MTLEDLIASMTPEIRERLTRAVELGKWPDGQRLGEEQRELVMQALMLWQARHDADNGEAYTIGPDGELRFLCESEKERLEAATQVFNVTLN